ncbi:MAG TPA: hypothetical protein VK993_09000 [Chthoniobacterales bacterium]|nr:hypothetical protein [Chthoniobacterales bacterium]
MQRPSPWLMLVVVLLGLLLLREPAFRQWDEVYLRWLLKHSQPAGPQVPLTVVEIGRDPLMEKAPPGEDPAAATGATQVASGIAISPLEFALFLQSALEFQPEVVAFETVLRWRERDKDQEQVFIDQAMRVPKLLLGAELTSTPDPDAPVVEFRGFKEVKGRRGNLPEFSGVGRQPAEDMRLISTVGFVNLPDEVTTPLRVPLLFLYRGEVVPAFPLQAILLWLRITAAEVKIEIGSHIELPGGKKIPIGSDGTVVVHPNGETKARRLTLNELLLATQHRESPNESERTLTDLKEHIVLARTPANPLAPPDVFAATIATIQSNTYLRRITWLVDCVLLIAIAACATFVSKMDRTDLILAGIAVSAGYCLAALAILDRWQIWLPGTLPIGTIWLLVLFGLIFRKRDPAAGTTVAIPPPLP